MNYSPRNIVAFTLLLFVTLIVCGSLLAQDKASGQSALGKLGNPKAMRLQMSVPEVFVPPVNMFSVLQTVSIDTTQLKAEIEQITAKRKELAEFERHYKAVLKLKRMGK